jgi:hypothetical protein
MIWDRYSLLSAFEGLNAGRENRGYQYSYHRRKYTSKAIDLRIRALWVIPTLRVMR